MGTRTSVHAQCWGQQRALPPGARRPLHLIQQHCTHTSRTPSAARQRCHPPAEPSGAALITNSEKPPGAQQMSRNWMGCRREVRKRAQPRSISCGGGGGDGDAQKHEDVVLWARAWETEGMPGGHALGGDGPRHAGAGAA